MNNYKEIKDDIDRRYSNEYMEGWRAAAACIKSGQTVTGAADDLRHHVDDPHTPTPYLLGWLDYVRGV